MRAILISLAILVMSGPMLAQQRRQPTIVERTFVPDEPLPCVAFNRMATRLDAVYQTEEITKAEYDEGMKKYMGGTPEEGVDYFIGEKGKYQRTVSQAEGLVADVALEGQSVVIKALLESESARTTVVERYNKLVESVNAYNKAVNDLVVTVNTAMSEPKGSKLAPALNFNFVRLPPIACTGNKFAFTNSTAYMSNVRAMAEETPTIHCE